MAAVSWWQAVLKNAEKTPQGRKELAKAESHMSWWEKALKEAEKTPQGRKELAKVDIKEPTGNEKEEFEKAYKIVENAYLSVASLEYRNQYDRKSSVYRDIPFAIYGSSASLSKEQKDEVQEALKTMERLKSKYPGEFQEIIRQKYNNFDFTT